MSFLRHTPKESKIEKMVNVFYWDLGGCHESLDKNFLDIFARLNKDLMQHDLKVCLTLSDCVKVSNFRMTSGDLGRPSFYFSLILSNDMLIASLSEGRQLIKKGTQIDLKQIKDLYECQDDYPKFQNLVSASTIRTAHRI